MNQELMIRELNQQLQNKDNDIVYINKKNDEEIADLKKQKQYQDECI